MTAKGWWSSLYLQVLVAIAVGVVLGVVAPETGAAMKPVGDAFVALVKMIIGPVIFLTVVVGIAHMGDLRRVGRIGLKALVYFEVLTTLALVLGLVVVNLLQPGAGMGIDPASLDASAVADYRHKAEATGVVAFLQDVIPKTFVSAFTEGNLLQVLLVSLLFGIALAQAGAPGRAVLDGLDRLGKVFFGVVHIIMRFAPIGAFGAMAFTVGKYGVATLLSLGQLLGSVYITCLIFIFGVLGIVCAMSGFSVLKLIRYIREELLIVLGTSSSESVLPRMLAKMENLGCDKSVVGLVIPSGYSFNLDGTCIYLTMAAVFLAQATNTPLNIEHQLGLIAILLLTSKGAAGVTGSGFIVLAATLASVGTVPVASIAIILGVDRFMSEARALTNLIGNAVATVVVARWEGAVDMARLHRHLNRETDVEADDPEAVLVAHEIGAEPHIPGAAPAGMPAG